MFRVMKAALESSVAPDIPRVVDFKHHWNMFLSFYASSKPTSALAHKNQPIEKTNLRYHLNQLLKILMQEEEEEENDGGIGPCLEFLIHHQILDILSTLCQADIPPGIRPYIFNLVNFVFTKIRTPLLPYIDVYLPLRRLLMLCAIGKASPTESQEICFITSLVGKMKERPELLSLFAHASQPGSTSHSSSRRTSRRSSMDLSEIEKMFSISEEVTRDLESQHLILAALLNYVDSADYLVCCEAMRAVIIVSSLPDETAALNAVHGTPFGSVIAKRLTDLFQSISESDVDPRIIESCQVNWMEAFHVSSKDDNSAESVVKPEILSFFAWLDFCDNLIKDSHPLITQNLVASIRETFLENCLEVVFGELMADGDDDDLGDDEDGLSLLCSELSQIWNHIKSPELAQEFSSWLLGNQSGIELNGVVTHALKHVLIEFCLTSVTNELTLEALHLFETLLERPCQSILRVLVFGNLETRGYYHNSLVESQINSWSDEEDEREKLDRESRSSRTFAPTNIHRIINVWLFLAPNLNSNDNGSYEQYLTAAEEQVLMSSEICREFHWPLEATYVETSDSSKDSRPEADPTRLFYEGEFLAMCFDLIERALDSDYRINLQVTSILSKIAILPHPYVHEYLLNPTIPIVPGTRTLYSTLKKVLNSAMEKMKEIDQLQTKIHKCRKTLLGSKSGRISMNLSKKEGQLIDGVIVLEEFCKELAAITLAKYNNHSTISL